MFVNGYVNSLPRNAGGQVRSEHLIRQAAMVLHVYIVRSLRKKKSCGFDLRPVYSCYFDDLCLS